MSFSVRKTRFKFSFTLVNTSPNSGVRWWMIGSAPAAETSGGIGVGPGDIRRYLFIMGASSLTAFNRTSILDLIVADGYMMGHLFYKVLLFAFARVNPVCRPRQGSGKRGPIPAGSSLSWLTRGRRGTWQR